MRQPRDPDTILEVKNLKKHFPIQKGFFKRLVGHVRAVDGVDFTIRKGETLGVVGESGCGKTTLSRCIMQLLRPTEGEVNLYYDGSFVNLTQVKRREMARIYRDMQIIFQDPFSSLDPRMTVRAIIEEPLRLQKVGDERERRERVSDLMSKVGLNPALASRYPHEFSGGMRQRIGIARALALQPKLVICDEPVSALDVSVQAQVLNLLESLQEEMDLTFLFIAHDLSVIEHISDRVLVMYLGRVVELAPADDLYSSPLHPYSEALLSAIPRPLSGAGRTRIKLEGNVPSPSNPPSGCHFHPRCRYADELCRRKVPKLEAVEGTGRSVRCHHYRKLDLKGYNA